MSNYKLENWAIVYKDNNPYQAPEMIKSYLTGEIYNRPGFEDGGRVTTSHIIELDMEKKIAKTKSGTVYELGEPSQGYTSWLNKNKA